MTITGKGKILLLFPGKATAVPTQLMPMSVLTLAAPLRRAGYEPLIIDQRVEPDYRASLATALGEPDLLFAGVSTLTGTTIGHGLELARLVREINPRVPLVWGGVHPTLTAAETLRDETVDIVCRGEGERVVVNLAEAIHAGAGLEGVRGISYKVGGRIAHNPDEELIDLDTLPPLDLTAIETARYQVADYFQYQSSRGCPHRCDFCDVRIYNRGIIRKKSAAKVIEELTAIGERFHPATIEFIDDNFLVDRGRVREVFAALGARGLRFAWLATCRADYFSTMSGEFLDYLKESGCREIYVGAESGSQRVLDLIHKDITVENIIQAAEKVTAAGIAFNCNFMCGFPGEEREDVGKTIRLIKKIREIGRENGKVIIGGMLIYAPYPGTPLFDRYVRQGWKPPASLREWSRFRHNQRASLTLFDTRQADYLFAVAMVTWQLFAGEDYSLAGLLRWAAGAVRKLAVAAGRRLQPSGAEERVGEKSRPSRTITLSGRWYAAVWRLLKTIAYYRFKHDFYALPLDIALTNRVRDKLVDW